MFDISSLADQKHAAKIIDKLGRINMNGHYGQMNIKVASKVLDMFVHDNLLVRLDENNEKIKDLRADLSVFRNALWDLMKATNRGVRKELINEMLEDICRKIDERNRVYACDNVKTEHSKKLLEFCSRDRLQSSDKVEYQGRRGRIIYAGSELGNTITIAFDEERNDRITLPQESPEVRSLVLEAER